MINHRKVFRILFMALAFLCWKNGAWAQQPTLEELLATPYIDHVVGAPNLDRIAFTVNAEGKRNVYVADGPTYACRKLTTFDADEAQEITSLSFSEDGRWLVFVRGGDHGGNSAAVATNSASLVTRTRIQVYTLSIEDKKLYKIGVGDFPQFRPNSQEITYVSGGQVYISPINKVAAGKVLFRAAGAPGNLDWNADGTQLTFVSRRSSHSFIGVFEFGAKAIRWIHPAFHTDSNPIWSPDGQKIAFVRRDAGGGPVDSLTTNVRPSWSIQLADLKSGELREIYRSADNKEDGYPWVGGQANLHWGNADYLTFISYKDGWPHLYRAAINTGAIQQLTKGDYEVTDLAYGPHAILYSANTGTDDKDIDRSHIGEVDLVSGDHRMLTQGDGIETRPFYFQENKKIGFVSSTVQQAPLPQVYTVESNSFTKVGVSEFGKEQQTFVQPEQVKLRAKDGQVFHAQYFKPKDTKDKKPALLYIHGGPRRQMLLGWHHRDYYFYDYALVQYFVNQGFAVLSVNYRTGTGYGFDFQHPDHAGALGASEYQDIVASGEWLQKQQDIDANRIGVFGGSYGGFLTAMALGKNSDIFKVGVDIHGVHNRQKSQNQAKPAPDFEKAAELAWQSSPSKYVESWTSPVLLIHGDDDKNVGFGHSIDLYKRLAKKGVETEVLVFPDENHHWLYFRNQVRAKEATADFLIRKLK